MPYVWERKMNVRIEVTYNTDTVEQDGISFADDRVLEKMDEIGAEFYASGYNIETGVRDLAFDLRIKDDV